MSRSRGGYLSHIDHRAVSACAKGGIAADLEDEGWSSERQEET